MSDLHRFTTPDPRDDDGEVELTAEFAILDYGADPHGYGENFDPGHGPDIDFRAVRDCAGHDLIKRLSEHERELIEDDIRERFDFRRAKRDANEADAHDEREAMV